MYKFFLIKPVEENLFEGLGIEGKPSKPKRFEYFSKLTFEELKGRRVYLILKTPQFFYEIYGLNLPAFSEEIVRLRLTDRVNTTGYLTGSFSLFWKILKKEGNFFEISYLALENRELLALKNSLKGIAKCKLEGITFLPFALARALQEVKEPAFLIHQEREGLWILIFKEGLPLYIEFLRVDELLGVNFEELKGRLNFLKNLYFRDQGKEINRVYLFNKELKEGLENSGLEVLLEERAYPEFLYASLVEPSFNLLPEEERAVKEVVEWNYKISFGFFVLSLLFFLGGLGLRERASFLEKEMAKKEALVTESINQLLREYPEEKIRNFRAYLEERERLLSLPAPSEIIAKIALSSEGVKITSLEVKEGNNIYFITLSGEKRGGPEELSLFSQEFVKKISRFIQIQQNQFDYSQEKNIISFKLSGTLKP